MTSSRTDVRRLLLPLGVFLLVFAVRVTYWAALEASPLSEWHLWLESDENAFVSWSASLASGNWLDLPPYRAYYSWQVPSGTPEEWERRYVPNAYFQGPLYAYALAGLWKLFGTPFLAARLLQLLLAAATSALLASAGRRLLLRRGLAPSLADAAGGVAGLLYGLYGPLVFHDGFLYRDGPVAHVSTLLLALPLLLDRASRRTGSFAVGLLGGAAVLLKQTTAPLALASAALLAFRSEAGRARRQALGAGALGLALPLAVLAARNLHAGVPPLTFDTRQAMTLVWANARGAGVPTVPSDSVFRLLDEAKGSTLKAALLVAKGYRGHGAEWVALEARKLLAFFNGYEIPDNASFYFFRDRLPALLALPLLFALLGPGLVGLVAAGRTKLLTRAEAALAWVAFLTPLASCLVAQPISRYRLAAAGPLALGAGLGLGLLVEGWRGARRGSAVAGVLAALLLSGASILPPLIPAPRHRVADTLVAATLSEARGSPEAGAGEILRYVKEGGDDTRFSDGLWQARRWWAGERAMARLAPGGVAPPERRFRGADPPPF